MEAELARLTSDGAVATITLARPQAHNALSGAMAERLRALFATVSSDPSTWAVVLRAEGEKAFCVGADLKERAAFGLDDFMRNRKQIRGMFDALRAVPQPTIASVHGFALGGGFELALSCDLIVAADDAVFGLPEVRVGLLPAGGGTQLLTRKVGVARAKRLIFRGERFSAQEALSMGLVTAAVPRSELAETTRGVADDICRSSPRAVLEAKRAIDAALGLPLDVGLELEDAAWRTVVATDDRAEGITAFNEKRAPAWKNR